MDTLTDTIASINESTLKTVGSLQEQVLAFQRNVSEAVAKAVDVPSLVPPPRSRWPTSVSTPSSSRPTSSRPGAWRRTSSSPSTWSRSGRRRPARPPGAPRPPPSRST